MLLRKVSVFSGNIRLHPVFMVAALLGLMTVLSVWSMRDDSATYDEIPHIVAGYTYLTMQDFRLNPEHPPLIKDLAALPLLFLDLNFPDDHPAWTDAVNGQRVLGPIFLFHSGNEADQILFWARLLMTLLLIILGLFLFFWTRQLAGNGAALLVLVFFAFSPNFLAHGRLVTTDVAVTLGIILSLYFYLRFLRVPSWRHVVLAGITLGFALLVKFSTITLVPFFVFLTFVYWWTQNGDEQKKSLVGYSIRASVVGLIAVLIIGFVYQLHIMNYPVERQIQDSRAILGAYYGAAAEKVPFEFATIPFLRPYAHYLLGLMSTMARAQLGGVGYFLGETGPSGWWNYFPVLYLFKVPIAFHALSLGALFVWYPTIKKQFGQVYSKEILKSWLGRYFLQCSMVSFIFFYAVIAIGNPLNIGLRHLLPIFPFLYILVALGIKKVVGETRFPSVNIKTVSIAALLGWYVFSSISVFPHYLSYYNEFAGGTSEGYKTAGDSNYDWGQDLKRLGQWVDNEEIESIHLDYFGRAEPSYYLGERYIPWRGSSWWELRNVERDSPDNFPLGNYLGVSATFLPSGGWTKGPSHERDYAWLRDHNPVERIGSIFVYLIE